MGSANVKQKVAREAGAGRGPNSKKDRKGRQFITALARGLDVMRAFRTNDPPLSNQELARRTRLPRPTISRITYTLTEQGYLTYHESLGCYELGGATLALGHVARATFNVLSRARPAMQRMAELTGANVGLGVREKSSMVYLETIQGPSLVGLRLEVGSRVPLLSSAMGRAYLAASAQDRNRLIDQLGRTERDDKERIALTLDTAARELKSYGFCISAGDWHPDIHGVAVPVHAPEIEQLFVVNCGGPAYLLPKTRLIAEIGPELVKTANQIREALGSVTLPRAESAEHERERAPRANRITSKARQSVRSVKDAAP